MNDDTADDLLLPLVTVASVGGPHDDDAYTAGFEMGALDSELRTLANLAGGRPVTMRCHLHSVNLHQADLIAMRYAMTTSVVDRGRDGPCDWADVEFRQARTA